MKSFKEIQKQEQDHIHGILSALTAFRKELYDGGFEKAKVMARLDQMIKELIRYNRSLSDLKEDGDSTHIQKKEQKFCEFLILIKAQLFLDISKSTAPHKAPKTGSPTVEIAENNEDLFNHLNDVVQSGQKMSEDCDKLFVQLNDIVQQQNNYMASLLGEGLRKNFFN